MKRKKTKTSKMVIPLIILVVAVIAVYFLYSSYSSEPAIKEPIEPVYTQEFPINLSVSDKIGVTIETEPMFQFGILRPGDGAKRYINFTNKEPYTVTLRHQKAGALSDWMKVIYPPVVESGKTVKITIEIKVPKKAEHGNYKGTVKMFLYKQ